MFTGNFFISLWKLSLRPWAHLLTRWHWLCFNIYFLQFWYIQGVHLCLMCSWQIFFPHSTGCLFSGHCLLLYYTELSDFMWPICQFLHAHPHTQVHQHINMYTCKYAWTQTHNGAAVTIWVYCRVLNSIPLISLSILLLLVVVVAVIVMVLDFL